MNLVFVRGELRSPYYIFVRASGNKTDADLLRELGLGSYVRREKAPQFGRYAILADDGQWTLIADDGHYTLWNRPTTRPVIADWAQHYDVFTCSIGDCDRSFDFTYYRDGKLARACGVADPDNGGGTVWENIGAPLSAEPQAFQLADERHTVLAIAASLGIQTRYGEAEVRIYAP